MPTRCFAVTRRWSGIRKPSSRNAACAGIADASRATTRWKRTGRRFRFSGAGCRQEWSERTLSIWSLWIGSDVTEFSAFDLEQLDVEYERRIGRDHSAGTAFA